MGMPAGERVQRQEEPAVSCVESRILSGSEGLEGSPAVGTSQRDVIILVHRKVSWGAGDRSEGPKCHQGHEGSCYKWTQGLKSETRPPGHRTRRLGAQCGRGRRSRFGGIRANATCPAGERPPGHDAARLAGLRYPRLSPLTLAPSPTLSTPQVTLLTGNSPDPFILCFNK